MTRGLATLLLLSLVLSGCSDADVDRVPAATDISHVTPSPPTSRAASAASSEELVARRFLQYADAYFGGDAATGHAMLSERCRGEVTLAEFASITESVVEVFGELEPTVDDVTINGDRATLDVTFGVPAMDAAPDAPKSVWVREHDNWFNDRCSR